MTEAISALTGAFLFVAGYLLCYFTVKKPEAPQETATKVKRVKQSRRDMLNRYKTKYEECKNDKGLYVPQKPVSESDKEVR